MLRSTTLSYTDIAGFRLSMRRSSEITNRVPLHCIVVCPAVDFVLFGDLLSFSAGSRLACENLACHGQPDVETK